MLEGDGDEWINRELGATLREESTVVHSFNRRVSLRTRDATTQTRQVHFIERVHLKPGEYTLTAVMTAPDAENPYAAQVQVVVPEIPRRELFLVGPLLGKRAGADVMVFGGWKPESSKGRGKKDAGSSSDPSRDRVGASKSFEPLLVQRAEGPEPLLALTQACMVKSKRAPGLVRRALSAEDGTMRGALPPVELALEGEGDVRCQAILDVLPVASLEPGRYTFTSTVGTESDPGRLAARALFVIRDPNQDVARSP